MGDLLEIAKVMVEPATKLLEMCGNAIGTAYEPWHMRRMADAEAYKIRQLGAAISETNSLPVEYENGSLSMNTANFEDFVQRAQYRANYQLLREQKNVESVVGKAYQDLLDAPKVANDPVDEDWTTRFFNIAKEINTEEMQHIWGKILSGEVAHPGNFSLRTLDTIRNISKVEAEIFQKVSGCVLCSNKDGLIPQSLSLLEKQGVSYNDLILLSEAGLLNLSSITYALDFKANTRFWLNFISKKFLLRITGDSAKVFRFSYGVYKLTSAGSELYSIIDSAPSEEYMFAVASDIGKHFYNNADIAVHRIISCESKEISYEENPVFEQKRVIKA